MMFQRPLEMENAKLYQFFTHFLVMILWDSSIKNDHEGQQVKVFQVLSNKPKEILDYHMDAIEAFIKVVYYPSSKNPEKLQSLTKYFGQTLVFM